MAAGGVGDRCDARLRRFDPQKSNRRSIRLKGYDYTQPGAYFLTVCTIDRTPLLGSARGGDIVLNAYGEAVEAVWQDLPRHYRHIALDAFVVMPDHFHGIVIFLDPAAPAGWGFNPERAGTCVPTGGLSLRDVRRTSSASAPQRHALPEVVRALKTYAARRINALRETPGASIWQRDYYEHVIRDEADLNRIRDYIRDNPARWTEGNEPSG